MKIKKLEDIIAWQKARELVKEIYHATKQGKFSKDFALANQIRSASISVASNIAEGFGRQTDKEFIQFLYIAKGSVAEVQCQLYLALDLGYIDGKMFEKVFKIASEVGKLISGFISYLREEK